MRSLLANGNGAYAIGTGVEDCDGHGTHVSGTIGSSVYGMAQEVTLHPVRVLDGNGNGTDSGVIAGMNWVAANAPANSVVNMSLGGTYSSSVQPRCWSPGHPGLSSCGGQRGTSRPTPATCHPP